MPAADGPSGAGGLPAADGPSGAGDEAELNLDEAEPYIYKAHRKTFPSHLIFELRPEKQVLMLVNFVIHQQDPTSLDGLFFQWVH